MKRLIGLACALVMLAGCGGTQKPADINKFFVTESIALTKEMHELTTDEEYARIFTMSDEMAKITAKMAQQDYSEPETIYLIKLPDTLIRDYLQMQSETEVSDNLLKKIREKWNAMSFASLINGVSGVDTLAASSIVAWEKSYIQPEGWRDNVMLLLDYDGEFSSLVSFTQSGDGVISASASFVRDDGGNLMESFTQKLGGIDFDATEISGETLNGLLAAK